MAREKQKSKPVSKQASGGKPPVPRRPDRAKSRSELKTQAEQLRTRKADDQTLNSLLVAALRERTFLRLTLSQQLTKSETTVSKVTVRPIDVSGQTKYQWTARTGSKELHENLSADELVTRTNSTFESILADGHLFTTQADVTVRHGHGGPQKIKRKPPSLKVEDAAEHNRQKQYLIPAGVPCAFLAEIGIMTSSGQVKPTMYHKFRQINRYLEFVEDLFPHLPETGPIRVVDFGCGKSYLTFALHHLFTKIHGREVSIIGLDLKADVIEDCSRIAKSLDCKWMSFQIGRIESYVPADQVHLAVSLHACDTATDDAIAAAVRWNCDAILAVPCCQHEVCQILARQSLPGITEYGILKERFASLATDALRAQYLELRGYRTQVLEFIETEHTPKNLLIRAVRRRDGANDQSARREVYEQLKQVLGITEWHLESILPLS